MALSNPLPDKKDIPTLVKDSALVLAKRLEIVEAAVGLFVRKGFHQTTTREIAQAAGFSIGTLYEYIASKEDVLYLVCESIHAEMEARLKTEIAEAKTSREVIERAFAGYIRACDRMQDSILLIYRETASLAPESARYVLANEERITEMFERILEHGASRGEFRVRDENARQLMAHDIVVLGHMWAFRRWFLHGKFSVEEYIQHQTSLIMGELLPPNRDIG